MPIPIAGEHLWNTPCVLMATATGHAVAEKVAMRPTIETVGISGADGIVSDSLKKTQEKPLNLRTYYHLLILALSVRRLREPLWTPQYCPKWATVGNSDSSVSTLAQQQRSISG
jgi:hypothetical protein